MTLRTNYLPLALAAALALAALLPAGTDGAPDPDPQGVVLLRELALQQKTLSENQAKIDEKVAAVAEEIRIARIYVSRGGSK